MKYVIFKRKFMQPAVLAPIVFHEHINHCDISIGAEYTPYSAGFCHLSETGLTVSTESSTSLNIGPKEDDHRILSMFLGGSSVLSFIDEDPFKNI